MKCKKHGEHGHTLHLSIAVQPVIKDKYGKEVELEPYDRGETFCIECLCEFLKNKIGVMK